jgi:uncharacterized protein YjcR
MLSLEDKLIVALSQMLERGMSIRDIAAKLGVKEQTVHSKIKSKGYRLTKTLVPMKAKSVKLLEKELSTRQE